MMWVKEVPKGAVKIAHRHFCDTRYGYDETLYLGLDHAFYLKGKGGPDSIWGVKLYGIIKAPGKGVLQLESEEARDWLNGVSWKIVNAKQEMVRSYFPKEERTNRRKEKAKVAGRK